MDLTEEEYNKEVAALLERIRCPLCSAPPKVIEGVVPGEGTVVTCRGHETHTYMINQEEEDEI